jgi:hypothetical protein
LPASWDSAEVLNIPVLGGSAGLYFTKKPGQLEVYLSATESDVWKLRSDLSGASLGPLDKSGAKAIRATPQMGLRIPIPELELDNVDPEMSLIEEVSNKTPNRPAPPGARTTKFRVLHSENQDRKLTITIEGLAGSDGVLRVIRNGHFIPEVKTEPSAAQDASVSYRSCDGDRYACKWMPLVFHFPSGEGWQTITVTLTW